LLARSAACDVKDDNGDGEERRSNNGHTAPPCPIADCLHHKPGMNDTEMVHLQSRRRENATARPDRIMALT
jgi:hypothetical protein